MTKRRRFILFAVLIILIGVTITTVYWTQMTSGFAASVDDGIATSHAAVDTRVAETFAAP